MIKNSYACSIYFTMSLMFSREFLWYHFLCYHLFMARYLRRIRVSCAKCANEIAIRGSYWRGNVIYISHRDKERIRKSSFTIVLLTGGRTIYGSRMTAGTDEKWDERAAFRTLWYHTILYKGDDIRRMFLKAREGFSFSVGNTSNHIS